MSHPETQEKSSPKKEHHEHESSDSDDEHDHDHSHPHDHGHEGHDHDHDGHDHGHEKGDKKSSRGEKKFKKAMLKLGMKPVSGINRVTIKKAKSLLLYIDDPEILKNPGSENSYIIFGEAKMHDFNQNMANEELKKFKPEKAEEKPKTEEKAAVVENKPEVVAEGGELNEAGLDPESIKTVMDQTQCTREKAVKTLRKTNGDFVTAILELTENK